MLGLTFRSKYRTWMAAISMLPTIKLKEALVRWFRAELKIAPPSKSILEFAEVTTAGVNSRVSSTK